ncbi:MAG: 50S ribosomal protein L17 [Ureaplasma sp.]|nr:50S ribosomal protein L17 [Ureaplasma sp.]
MSFINKPGKTRSWRAMVTRQQVSDVLAYGQIITTHTKAKETQRHVERLITRAKRDTVANRRIAAGILLDTKDFSKDDLVKKLFNEIAKKYEKRPGGYTRVLKLDERPGDNTVEAVLQLV